MTYKNKGLNETNILITKGLNDKKLMRKKA